MFFTHKFGGIPYRMNLILSEYENGRLAVLIVDENRNIWTASINVPQVELSTDEFVFKTGFENDGLFEFLTSAGVIEDTGRSVDVGLKRALPICHLVQH